MKLTFSIFIALILLYSCAKKETNTFKFNIPHYQSIIEIDGLKAYDTLISWDWYNDNMADDRRCYRIQNSELGIVMEKGMLPKYANLYNQITIETPIKPNKFGKTPIKEWLYTKRANYAEEHPIYKFPVLDSILIDDKKFGILSIVINDSNETITQIFYITSINDEDIEFKFKTNRIKPDSFYLKSLEMMKTLKVTPIKNKIIK